MYCALLLTAHAVLASVPVTVNVDLTTAKGVAYPHYWSAGVGSGNKINAEHIISPAERNCFGLHMNWLQNSMQLDSTAQ